jgi:DNA repair protein RadC
MATRVSEDTWDAFLPRERGLTEGFDTLADADLVAVLLGTGEKGRPVAHVALELLEQAGGVAGLSRLGPPALAAMRGIGPAKAARIAAGLELGRRAVQRGGGAKVMLAAADDVARWAAPRLTSLDHEQIWALSLDGRNGLRFARRVAEGGLHGCSIDPRDILRAVVRDAASAFVLVHNHPSGDPAPSADDVDLTRRVSRAADAIGTPLVDHVIVAGARHASLLDLGLLH